MAEYYQLTLDDWLSMKQKLQAELLGVRKSFVRIGYMLRKIDESKGYERDGYKTVAEWAQGEYGIKPTTTSRFMAINREYSIGGYSEELLPEYEEYNKSQLEEMLTLSIEDRGMIKPETARADIRQLKEFNKHEPEKGIADDFSQIVKRFFEDKPDLINEVYAAGDLDSMKEAVNPSGNRTFRKGACMLMMYENELKLKKFGGTPEDYTWQQFFDTMKAVCSVGETSKPEIAPAQMTESSVNTEACENLEEEKNGDILESGNEEIDNSGEDRQHESGSADSESDERPEPERGECSGIADSETADQGESSAPERTEEAERAGTAETDGDAEGTERTEEAGTSEADKGKSEEQNSQKLEYKKTEIIDKPVPALEEAMNIPASDVFVEDDRVTPQKAYLMKLINQFQEALNWERWQQGDNILERIEEEYSNLKLIAKGEK